MKGMMNTIIFFVYLVSGLYFLDAPFGFLPFLPPRTEWYIFAGGVLLIFGGMKYLRTASSSGFGFARPI